MRIRQDPEGEPYVDEMRKDAIQSVLTDHMDFFETDIDIEGKPTFSAVAPPANVANYIYNRAKRNFRPLYSIARVVRDYRVNGAEWRGFQ